MGTTCSGSTQVNYSQFQHFFNKNKYVKQLQSQSGQKFKIVHDRVTPGHPQIKYLNLITYICTQPKLYFTDKYFNQLQPYTENTQSSNLTKLYNFQLLRLEKVYKDSSTAYHAFTQNQIQLSYLSAVFYLICDYPQLKEKMFITKYINPHSAYVVKLFCNGQDTDVVVDQLVPIHRRNIKFLTMTKPDQIWPFLLEKAWCKQIGGYDKARGLSPQDCFQEIYGIPAFSFKFKNNSLKEVFNHLRQAKERGYWVVLTTIKQPTPGLGSRQLFYLQKFNQPFQTVSLISPYTQFSYPPRTSESIAGQAPFSFNQLYTNFQFATIGAYQKNFTFQSLQFSSNKNQQKIFQLQLSFDSRVNIRINQFYSQYLSKEKKQFYKYSPVLMELYDSSYCIIQKCEGTIENLLGLRASCLSNDMFVGLEAGKYYLRVQIAWQNQFYNTANIVTYSPKSVLKIHNIQLQPKSLLDFSAKLLAQTLQKPNVQKILNQNQQIKVRHIQKVYGHIIGIQNMSTQKAKLKIIFKDSQNIRINHHQLLGEQKQYQLHFELQGEKQRILQILPNNPSDKYWLAPFDIVKI